MSATGLDVFDRTLNETHRWLHEIERAIGGDRQRSYHVLRAVLHALRDRLPLEGATHLSAQLPMLVRGIYWEGYKPEAAPDPSRTEDDFLAHVGERIRPAIGPIDTRDATRAVLAVLGRHVDAGQMAKLRYWLPHELRGLLGPLERDS